MAFDSYPHHCAISYQRLGKVIGQRVRKLLFRNRQMKQSLSMEDNNPIGVRTLRLVIDAPSISRFGKFLSVYED